MKRTASSYSSIVSLWSLVCIVYLGMVFGVHVVGAYLP